MKSDTDIIVRDLETQFGIDIEDEILAILQKEFDKEFVKEIISK